MFQVYTIEFSDGSTYVGSCRRERGYKSRYREHCTNPVNKLLDHKIRDISLTHELRLRGEYNNHADAIAAERDIALSLELPINVYEPTVSGIGRFLKNSDRLKRDHIPDLPHRIGAKRTRCRDRIADSTLVRCSKCRKRLPASKFPDDRSRFNGLHSRCYECRRESQVELQQDLIDQQRCPKCRRHIPEIYAAKQSAYGKSHLCEPCAHDEAARGRRIKAERRANGLCRACGEVPPRPNRTLCAECNTRHLAWLKRQRDELRAAGRCTTCGSPDLATGRNGKPMTVCQKCRDKRNQWGRTRRATALRVSD